MQKLSYSALRCFLTNEYEFYRRYVLKIDDDMPFSPSMRVGTQVHNMIEGMHKGFMLDEVMSKVQLHELDDALQQQQIKAEQYDKAIQQMTNAIDNYCRYNTQPTTSITEEYIVCNIPNTTTKLHGKIDAIVGRDIVDYKTVSKLTEFGQQDSKVDYLLQGGAYIRLAESQGYTIERVVFVELLKTPQQLPTMIKKDCCNMLDNNNIIYDKKEKKDDLMQKLLDNKVIEYQPTYQEVVYRNIEKMKSMFAKLFVAIAQRTNGDYDYIANPFLNWSTSETLQKTQDLFTMYTSD